MADVGGHFALEQLGLGSVLRNYQLSVPSHQREYAWTEAEVWRLFEDFAQSISDNEGPYFLGSIVTIPQADGELQITDGQQRLATTSILLSAIRDACKTAGEPMIVEAIENNFISGISRGQRERIPKLRLNKMDNDYFKARLEGANPKPVHESHFLIDQAFGLARKYVETITAGHNERYHGDLLNKWVDFIEHRAQVVLVRVSRERDAYKMFETLNDRGLKTSQADLVKNFLFSRAGGRMDEVEEKWAFMRGALEQIDEDDITITFLRHALIAIHGYIREPDVFDVVQDIAKSPQAAVSLATSLEGMATIYAALRNPEHEKWNNYPHDVRRAIETLNLFSIRPTRPLILAVAGKFTKAECAKAFARLISWSVRLMIAGNTRSGSVETPFATAAHKVQKGEIKTADELRAELKGAIPIDAIFRAEFERANVSKPALGRYYLRAVERVAKEEPDPFYLPTDDPRNVNLEHILPKKVTKGWRQFSEEERALYCNRIGNLALLLTSSNSDIRSDDFENKRAVYGATPYETTAMIARASDWTPLAIQERQRLSRSTHLRPGASSPIAGGSPLWVA